MSFPSVYPTGTTIFNPEKCWNGYTIFAAMQHGAVLIDMNGSVQQLWKGVDGWPIKLLPGGSIIASSGARSFKYSFQDQLDLIQIDWEGRITWRFNRHEFIEDPGEAPRWMARQHHDFQRQGSPVGYYAPGMAPEVSRGNTLILCHRNNHNPKISHQPLLDDVFIEIDWQGNMVWEWVCSEHFDELGFGPDSRKVLADNPNMLKIGAGFGDWMHINSMSRLGPNPHFDQGDQRFHPDNIIWSSRQSNIIAITDKKNGGIVWKIGPEYNESPALRTLGWIIGPHHAHIIPQTLPGGGNLIVFDNGGFAGYGPPNPGSANGVNHALRDYSRVLEIDPVSLKVVWQYTPGEAGCRPPEGSHHFYSPLVSSAQRLPNGNTMITLGCDGKIIEVTSDHQLVWEYINPFIAPILNSNLVYRAYRAPYDWIPQLSPSPEKEIKKIDITEFSLNGVSPKTTHREIEVENMVGGETSGQSCVLPDDERG